MRRLTLRQENNGADRRFLEAYFDDHGDLHVDGQDLGPGTAVASSDGEYEWYQTIRAAHFAELRTLLGAGANEDLLDVLARSYCGQGSYSLEKLLRESAIPIELQVWSG